MVTCLVDFFFFSSRRRHTRWTGDWSSDVCSSDLPSHVPGPPPATDADEALSQTAGFWADWVARCSYQGRYRDAVVRSLITIKALTYEPTGGIVAAPTTSLPEDLGGVRNWDYRYCW